MAEAESEVWFVNEYICYHCGHPWRDVYDACPDDDCPKCGSRHVSPQFSRNVEISVGAGEALIAEPRKSDRTIYEA